MKRHQARILSIIALYQYDINGGDQTSLEQAINLCEEYLEIKIEEDVLSFCDGLYQGTLNNLVQIDDIIKQSLFKWTIDRLSYVDRAIIRLATYELLYTDTPPAIIINEAVEITKYFCTDEDEAQVRFNNRLLDTIKEKVGSSK